MQRDQYDADHEAFRASVRTFIEREVVPHQLRWEQERNVDRQAWLVAGKQGLIGLLIPAEFGGAGVDDYRYRCVLIQGLAAARAAIDWTVEYTTSRTAFGKPIARFRTPNSGWPLW